MKLSELKQYLLNNLWWGENSRERNRAELLQGATFDERAAYFQTLSTPNPLYVLGFDDSHWGGELDFANTYARGMRFAFFKVMDGTIATKYWDINRPKAIQAGLIVGEYTWLYKNANVSCKAQAQAVWNRIKDQQKQLPLTVDFEWTNWNGSPSYPNYSDLDIWVTEFTRLSGYKPMLYSAAGYMNQFGAMPTALRNKFSRFFFANYGVSKPTLPLGFSSWDFWQFTASLDQTYYAPSSTNKKELDGDYWYATLYELQQIANTDSTPPPTDPPPTNGGTVTTYTVKAKADNTKIFKNYDGSGGDIDSNFDTNETAKGDSINYAGYMHLYQMNGVNINGYVHTSKITYTVDSVTPPPPPPDEEPTDPPPAGTTLPATVESTDVWKDDSGVVIATYKGTLTKQ